ncbi:MAG: ABC transporter ATP-binding protein [Chloroflexi bacterium]|nr:MAG: ABC transporter ATP-binding protein [Chloroflexota bacterium]
MFASNNQFAALLWRYLRPQWQWVLMLILIFFSGIALQLLSPQMLRRFIDTVQAGGTQNTLLRVALLFLAVVVLQRTAAIVTTYVSRQVAWAAMNGLRRDLVRHVLKLDLSFHNARTPGELLERIYGDVDRLANFFSEFLLQIVGGLLLTVGVLALLWLEEWRIAALLALFVVAYVLVHTRGQALAAPEWAKERQFSADLTGLVEERVAGARDIHTSGAVAYTMHRFLELLRRTAWQSLRADITTDIGWTISKIFYELGTVAGMAVGAYLFYQGQISLGVVYLILHYLAMLGGPLGRIADQLEDFQQARIAIARVQTLFATQSQMADGVDEGRDGTGGIAVAFHNVTFGYRADAPILHEVSFQLQPGETLGLLGRTGSGKSTIARLLFRLYDAQGGEIEVGGQGIRTWRLDALRRQIGLVTQEVQLFAASLRDNLTLFDPTIPDAAIWDSLRQLGLEGWVRRLPRGLDTSLAADGAGLSAGEAQLLALGRVFLKDPGLVILDEASSRLDPATEQLLERALDRLLAGRTVIIIAHRLATVLRTDKIVILEQGAVKEYGPTQALAADPASLFAGLLRTAAGDSQSLDHILDAAPHQDLASDTEGEPEDSAFRTLERPLGPALEEVLI